MAPSVRDTPLSSSGTLFRPLSTPVSSNTDSTYLHLDSSESPGEYNARSQRFWSIYVSETQKYDGEVLENWKASTDSALIFAGLFSAIVTAFLLESAQDLQLDPAKVSSALLFQLVSLQSNGSSLSIGSSSATLLDPLVNLPFQAPKTSIAVNVLWFLSLGFSLGAALAITLIQQWIRGYLQTVQRHTAPLQRARIRTFLFRGMEKWGMEMIVGVYIPVMMHSSMLLFLIGLCFYLYSINIVVTWSIASLTCIYLFLYVMATTVPIFDLSTPYETPLSQILWQARLSGPSVAYRDRAATEIGKVDRQQRDYRALEWLCQNLRHDTDLQTLVESIPGLLSSEDGRNIWDIGSAYGSAVGSLTVRITTLLATCLRPGLLDPDSRLTRATICLDALAAISQCSRGVVEFGNDLILEILPGIAALQWGGACPLQQKACIVRTLLECRSPPSAKWRNHALPSTIHGFDFDNRAFSPDISAGTMWSAQIVYFDGPIHTLPESVMPLIQYNLPTLLEKADSALHFVDQQGRNLERMLFEPDVPAPHNVGVALQQYMRALEDANTDVYACAQVLQHFFNRVYPAEDSLLPHHILDFFTRLPLVNEHAYTVVFHGIEHLKGGKFHAIFTVPRVLADLRRRGVLPDLPELETPSFIPDHSLQRLHARYLHNPQNLYGDNDIMDREVLPISMCLTILSPTWRQSKIAVNFSKLKWHNDTFPWLNRQGGLESPALSLLPKLFNNIPGPVRPMKVFSYVMEDIEHDGKIMELASFICNVVFAPSESTAQMAFAKEALDILLKKWRLTYDSSWHDRPERAIPTRGQSTSAVVVNLSIPIPKFRRTKPTVVEEEEDGHSLHLCEGSQILLVGLVKHLLEIERSARDGSRPFPTFIVDVVASLVRQTLTKEVPIHIAEELFKLVPTASTTLTVRTEIVCARMHEEREVSTTFKLE